MQTLSDIPEVKAGDDLAAIIIDSLSKARIWPCDHDIFVLAQKIVSKAEGRLVNLADVTPSPKAIEMARVTGHDPRLDELVLSEAVRIVIARRDLLLVEHRLGFVMPNAGIDRSNIPDDHALLLPLNPDSSAVLLRRRLCKHYSVKDIGIVIVDTVSRAWRHGACGVAIGSAGLPVLEDQRGRADMHGRALKFTVTAFADEIAASASLIMGQANEGTPVVLIRGLKWQGLHTRAMNLLIRPSETENFARA